MSFNRKYTVFVNEIIAECLSARQLIQHRISASVCIYVCVMLKNAIILRAAACAWHGCSFCVSSHVLLPCVLAEVESKSPTTTARRVGKGLGILLHYAKESNERHTKPKPKDQRMRSHKSRGAYTY